MTKKDRVFIPIISTLAALEFFFAAWVTFSQSPDPKNAIFLGYSSARWSVAILAIGCGITCLYLARHTYQGGLPNKLQTFLSRHFSLLRSTFIALFIIGVLIILVPPDQLGKYAEYFARLRPLLLVVTTLPLQFFIQTIFKTDSNPRDGLFKNSLPIISILTILVGFIALTRLGLEPDTFYWNVAGVPLTTLQLTLVFLITVLSVHLINKILFSVKISPIVIDLCIALLIYTIGVSVWSQTPMLKHFNALQPAPPAFQYFPYSDARTHDLGAISIRDGYGIYYGEYTDKPLYMVFLSILHHAADNNYNMLSLLHLCVMGLILPGLFLLGKQFHSRHLGIALALIILIRQRNAILLAHLLAGTNPKILITEIPTMLGLIVLCIIAFWWIRENWSNKPLWSHALLAGGALGALSLIRLNPIGLLPIILPISAIALRRTFTNWFRQILIFMLGFLIVLAPWALTGQDANGNPYLWVKFLDVLNVRYVPQIPFQESNNQVDIPTTIKVASLTDFHPVKTPSRMDIQNFPGFAINHALHNIVTSFLTLPDSISQNNQSLKNLLQRPYLDEKANWRGEFQAAQVPFLVLNLFLLALGLGWSWGRWKWAGIFPVCIFFGYIITLGLARTSGSRYIVPIDWILFFYYVIGIIAILEKFTTVFENIQIVPLSSESRIYTKPIPLVFAVATILVLAIVTPLSQTPILSQNIPPCENGINIPAHSHLNLLKGKALYPYWNEKTFSFVFLTCGQTIEISIEDYISLKNEQKIIIGFSRTVINRPEAFFFEEPTGFQQVWGDE